MPNRLKNWRRELDSKVRIILVGTDFQNIEETPLALPLATPLFSWPLERGSVFCQG